MNQSISPMAIDRIKHHALKIVHKKLTHEAILQEVSREFQISIHQVLSRSTADQIVYPRLAGYLFSIYQPGYTLKRTGADYGGRDHSTILRGLRTALSLYDTDRDFRERVNRIRSSFNIHPDIFQLHIKRWRNKS